MKNRNNIVFTNYFVSIWFLFMGSTLIHLFFTLYLKMTMYAEVLSFIVIGYFWISFYFRIVYIHEDYIEFYFPLRFKPFYRRRQTRFLYAEIEKVIVFSGHGYAAYPKLKFVLKKKRHYLWIFTNDSYGIMPDSRIPRLKRFLTFLKGKNVQIVLKVNEDSKYRFEPEDNTNS